MLKCKIQTKSNRILPPKHSNIARVTSRDILLEHIFDQLLKSPGNQDYARVCTASTGTSKSNGSLLALLVLLALILLADKSITLGDVALGLDNR